MDFESFSRLLQMSISPMVLISGAALLLLSLTGRLARPVDRARRIMARIRDAEARPDQNDIHQLGVLLRRCEILRWAIGLLVFSILSSLLMILLMIAGAFISVVLNQPIVWILTISVLSLLGSVVIFLYDVTLSLKALKIDTRLVRGDGLDDSAKSRAKT